MRSTLPAMALVAIALAGWGSAGIAGADPAVPTPAPAAPRTSIDHDGIFVVGADIAPGVYASAGPIADGTCYWKRTASAPEGQTGDTLDRAMTHQPQVVRIDATDGTFKTSGCQTWHQTDAEPPGPGLPPLLVGLQMRGYLDALNRNAQQFEAQPPETAQPPAQVSPPAG